MNDLYLTLLKQNWTLPEIDDMDILHYFRLIRHSSKKQQAPTNYIDQIPGL